MEDTKEDKIGYKFFYKDFKGEMNDIVVSVKTKDCELAIATFEHMYPNVTWRRFQLVGQEHSQIRVIEEPQISLSEACKFFHFADKKGWRYKEHTERWMTHYPAPFQTIENEELYQLFLESKLKSND